MSRRKISTIKLCVYSPSAIRTWNIWCECPIMSNTPANKSLMIIVELALHYVLKSACFEINSPYYVRFFNNTLVTKNSRVSQFADTSDHSI